MKFIMEHWRRYILDESAYKDALNKPPRGVPLEKWKELVNIMRDMDPTGKSKYLRWITDDLWAIIIPYNAENYTDERADELNIATIKSAMEIIQKYDKLLPHIKASPEHRDYVDINTVQGVGYLRNLVNDVEAVANKKDALKKMHMDDADLAKIETEVIIQTKDYIVRRPYTTLACQKYSKGAPWCIGADDNNQFLGYIDENMVPYILEFTNKEIPHGHFLKKVAILVHYDSYDPDATMADDQIYDANNETLSMEGFRDMIEDIIPEEELEHILKEIKMNAILRPPFEGGIGSDIGEKFKGDAEWEHHPLAEWEQEANEGRDYQKESEKIKQHPKNKEELLDKGANKETGGGKGHIKLSFKRGKSAPPG